MANQFDRNAVAIFSSGIALYKRVIKLRAGEKRLISLPVKREHLDNVLRSFSVKGKGVTWSRQASYTSNQQSRLTLDLSSVTESLATNLAGARMKLTKASGQEVVGVLLGLDSRSSPSANGQGVLRNFFTVRTRQGNVSVAFDEVRDYRFTDKVVRDEIKKALDQHFQQIKPDAVNFEVELTAQEDVEATVLYTQPAAAWKLSYRLRESAANRFDLEAYAVVDNNTAQDWSDYRLALVNGDPIHFSSNIADVVLPERQFVNAITAKAAGPVTAETGGFDSTRNARAKSAPHGLVGGAGPQMAGLAFGAAPEMADAYEGPSSFTPQASSSEVGDFNVYTAQDPVSIGSGSSGLIPVFQLPLDNAGSYLFYDPAKDNSRPWRAIRFKAPESYGRGLCTVFLQSDGGDFFGGECTLDAAKAGEDRMAVHQRETGVKIQREVGQTETRRISIAIANGVLGSEVQYTQKTTYRVRNNTGTSFKLALDQNRQWGSSTLSASCGECTPESEPLTNGTRFTVELASKAEIAVEVTERLIQPEELKLGQNPVHFSQWLRNNVVNILNPLAEDDKVLKCLAIHAKIDDANRRLNEETARAQTLVQEQNELRQNLTAAGESAPYRSEWQNDLYENQKALRKSQKELQPAIRKELEGFNANLLQALKALTVTWKD